MKRNLNDRIVRQATRGTLRICPGQNNERVFQIFGGRLREDLQRPESLMRLRYGVGNTNVERLAAVLFKALKAGEFHVSVQRAEHPQDRVLERLFLPSSVIQSYTVKGKLFRRIVETAADAERVLEGLGIEFIRETGGPLSKEELDRAYRLLNPPKGSKEWFVPKPL